ncbi:MAG: hypothetical protein HY275_09615 [Gemmatimonadetes bacterium]|nr:hypothetical protein [Gemmatimonadota bacterium]
MGLLLPALAHAQTDFRNLDRGRPFAIEDAIPIERWGLELQAAPLRLERSKLGVTEWGFEPAVAVGFLPRTEFELGLPFIVVPNGATRTASLAGVDLGVLHQLTAESEALPALALRGSVLVPAGVLGPTQAIPQVGVLLTRSFDNAVRVHANAEAALASGTAIGGSLDVHRWSVGMALDRTFVVRSFLVGVEWMLSEPLSQPGKQELTLGAGARWQLDPRWWLDVGAGQHTGASHDGWYLTAGASVAIGWRLGLNRGGR